VLPKVLSELTNVRLVMVMRKSKEIDYRIIAALMKNSKLSDRQLAKSLGVSQPTISRRRTMLEKTLIDNYTLIPKWDKLGYEILAINFVKIKLAIAAEEKYQAIRERGLKWLMKQPNIIMTAASQGMGMDAFNISLHRSYADYDQWFRNFRSEWGELVDDIQSVLVNLRGEEVIKPLNFKYLSEAI